MLGTGTFGQVVKVLDHKTQKHKALKIIRNKKRFHKQGAVEIEILETLKKQDSKGEYNCVKLLHHFYFRKHLCLIFDLLNINLYEFMKLNNFNGISLSLIRRFAIQLI